MDLHSLTIDAARSAVQERKTSAAALAEAFYAKIESDDPKIGAYLTLSKERALEQGCRDGCARCKRREAAAAGRRAGRNQRCDGHPGRAHHRGIEDSGQLHSALRLHGGRAAGSCRRGRARQAELRRVCHGIVERELGVEAGAQSARSEPRARRFVGRIGGGGGRGHGRRDAGIGHRRLDSPAGVVLRSGRIDADLRTRFALRTDRVCVVARSHRPAHARR